MSGGEVSSSNGGGLGPALIAVALVIALIGAGIGLFYQTRYDDDAANRAAEYSRYTKEKVAHSCRGIPALEVVYCFAKARIEGDGRNLKYSFKVTTSYADKFNDLGVIHHR